MKRYKRILYALTGFIVVSFGFTQPIAATLNGRNPGRCVVKPPTRTSTTFLQESSDGLPYRLYTDSNTNLVFAFRCNGARAAIRFRLPERVIVPPSPALIGATYNNIVTARVPGSSISFSSTVTQPSEQGEVVIPARNYTQNYSLSVLFVVRNGSNRPFLAGNYNYKFTATIEANF